MGALGGTVAGLTMVILKFWEVVAVPSKADRVIVWAPVSVVMGLKEKYPVPFLLSVNLAVPNNPVADKVNAVPERRLAETFKVSFVEILYVTEGTVAIIGGFSAVVKVTTLV
jgi:hypothetical protein